MDPPRDLARADALAECVDGVDVVLQRRHIVASRRHFTCHQDRRERLYARVCVNGERKGGKEMGSVRGASPVKENAPLVQSVDDSELYEGEKTETHSNLGGRPSQIPSTQRCGNEGTGVRVPIR